MCKEKLLDKEVNDTSELVRDMLLYKTKQFRLCCSKSCGVYKFKKGEYKSGSRIEKVWRYGIMIAFTVEVLFTIIDLVYTEIKRSNSDTQVD